MITRKTRLTSVLVAVIMMMTMLAAYVLPVTAEESSPYPLMRDMATLGREYADDWGIAAPEDWVAAVELSIAGENFSGKTLHFTKDIDFDIDGDGEPDEDEKVKALGGEAGFAGNIHGHGYVIKNVFVDHDITTEGPYGALVSRGTKSGQVFRDLGIASGKIYIHGKRGTDNDDANKMAYAGAFVSYGGGITFANCWNAAEVHAEVEVYEIDMAPFGRTSSATLINCFNLGNLTNHNNANATKDGAPATANARTDGLVDWSNDASAYYNCVSLGTLVGTQRYMFTYGSSVSNSDATQCGIIAGNFKNCYGYMQSDLNGFSNKSSINKLIPDSFELEMGQYTTGELASMLNDNYDSTFDSVYGRKYFKMENGQLAMTDDPYDALYKLTISKKIGDFVVSSDYSYVKATTSFTLPAYEGYELASHSDAIMPDYENNTFRMPPENAELHYAASVPDWSIIKDLIDKYDSMVESGHAKALNDSAALAELLDKLKLSYEARDTMSDEQAMARIALYVKDNANLDLSIRENLVYPNYPLMRYYDKSVSTVWGIKTLEDWQAAVKIGEEEGENFSGIKIHFLDDVDFKNIDVEPLCVKSGFAGTIYGHDKVIKNLLVDGTVDATYHALIARSSGGMLVQDLGIESGTVKVRGSGDTAAGAVYVGVFIAQGSGAITFANCWSNANIDVDVVKYEIDAATFGRTTAATTLINCINNGTIDVNVNGGRTARADSTLDWNYGTLKIANYAHTGKITTQGGTGYNQSYVVGLAGSASDVPEGAITNVYGTGETAISSKSYLNDLLPDAKITADMVASGELVWKLNHHYNTTYDETYGRKYYTLKDGKLAFGTTAEQAVRINVKSGDNVTYFYGFVGDTLDLGDMYTMGTPSFEIEEAYAATVNADNELTISSLPNGLELNVNVTFAGGLNYGALAEAIASYNDVENPEKYTSPLTTTSLSDKLTEVQNKTYTSQAEIDTDVEILKSYFYTVSIQEYASNPNESIYAVASVADLELVAKNKGNFKTSQTILFTANVTIPANYTANVADVNDMSGLLASIDGNGYILKGLRCTTNGWLGEYSGKFIKNITFEDCWTTVRVNSNYTSFLMVYNRANLLIENVTFDNCKEISNDAAGAGNRRSSIIVGNVPASCDLTLKNVTIKNCEIVSRGSGNSAFVVGNISSTSSKVSIDGLYVNNNIFSGPVASSGCAYLFGENNGTTVVENAAIFNNSLGVDDETIQGVITGSTKQGKLTLKNVMTYNNEGTDTLCGKTTDTTKNHTLVKSGIYSDASIMTVYPEENRADNSAMIFSGEAVALINATEPTMTWGMKSGLPVFSEKVPVKVTLDLLAGNDVVLYTDVDGKLIGLSTEMASKFWVGYEDLANAVFTQETTVVQAACNHTYVNIPNNDGTHNVVCQTVNGCGESIKVDCTLTYEIIDGITHTVKCTECGYTTTANCTKELVHTSGTYENASGHQEVCIACGYATESACDFDDVFVAHTDLAKGYTKYTCDCGYSYKIEEAEKAHVFDTVGTVVKAPGYGVKGLSKHDCSICSAYEYHEIDALTGTGINVVAPVSAMQGEEITVDLMIANNAGNIAGLNLELTYDADVLSLTKIEDNGIFALPVCPENTTPGSVRLTYLNAQNVPASATDGKSLTTLTFVVLDAAAFGTTEFNVEFVTSDEVGDTGVVDQDSNFVEVGEGNAVTEITSHLWGDADMNGTVNVSDAQTILQWKVAKDVNINLTAADADRDGEIGLDDALMLLQYCNQMVEWDPNGTTKEPATQA